MRIRSQLEPRVMRVPLDDKGPLGDGETGRPVLHVRQAETFEHMKAGQAAARLLAGILLGEDALRQVKTALGQEFAEADWSDPVWRETAANCVSLLELTCICAVGWDNVEDEDGNPLPEPRREYLALLLRDPVLANRIGGAIKQRVLLEQDEGNGSTVSPNGEAVIPTTATTAANQAPPAAAG